MPKRRAALIVGALALGTLTACGESVGSEAEEWLLSTDIVESVETDGSYSGFTFMPSTTAQLDPTASDAEVRALSRAASRYVADHTSLDISLALDGLVIAVPVETAQAAAAADLWARARRDNRIQSGSFGGVVASLVTTRALIGAVFPEYAAGLDVLEVASDESDWIDRFRLSGSAECFDEAATAVLLAEPSIAAASVDLCGEARLVTTSADELLPTAERLAPLLTTAAFATTVVFDTDPNLWFQTASRELPLARVSPELLGVLRSVETREPLVMRVEPEGRLFVEVELGDLRPAVTSILLDPAIEAVPALLVRAANVSVQSLDLAEASSFLDLAEGFIALDLSIGYFSAATDEVRYVLLDDELTEANGKRLVDLALSNDVWRTRSVAIVDYSDVGAVFVNGASTQADGEVGEAITAYWLSRA